jgi:hypothetical protein
MMRLKMVKLKMHTFPLTITLLVLNGSLISFTYNSNRRTWVISVLLIVLVAYRTLKRRVAISRLMEV